MCTESALFELRSPNNWLVKAGAYLLNDKVVLPHKFLLVPMTIASEEIVRLRNSVDLLDRTRHALTIALTVRIADTAFFTHLAKVLNQANPGKPNICEHCIRGKLFGTRIKELRQSVNSKIIHEMEQGRLMLNPEDFQIVDEYYEELFKLPLMSPISIPATKGLEFCHKCKKHWSAAYSKISS